MYLLYLCCHSQRLSSTQREWYCPGTQPYCGNIKRDLFKGVGLVKNPSPAQPSPSAAKQLLVTQGSAKGWQIQATFFRAEHRDLINMWWASHLYDLAPHENLPRAEKYSSLQALAPLQPSVPAFLPNGPLSVEEMENSFSKNTLQPTAQGLLLPTRLY